MKPLFGAVVAGALLSCLPAAAIAATEAVQVRVDYGDLDLSTPQGRATLARRAASAALDACTPELSGQLADHEAHRCRVEMRHDAAAQIEALGRRRQVDVAGKEMVIRSAS
jgi:UrcA family protein